ncbi:hypothetical protein Mgra_00006447 [Meloidogyne graminicola]|uniref:Uncharacterized protein n=1 Tax=Meloidogyne graminicola TaxID=189291 RepID=A0A8S9ZL76_9BILA|nr:hypothetical protein Mgra_00006447 [Meloidogyne graminicola]
MKPRGNKQGGQSKSNLFNKPSVGKFKEMPIKPTNLRLDLKIFLCMGPLLESFYKRDSLPIILLEFEVPINIKM